MVLEKFLRMVGGAGDSSYATNSKHQEKAILKIKPLLEEAVGELQQNLLSKKMVVVDLGCSSGHNTFIMMFEVMKIISKQCEMLGLQPPEMQLFLNDLPGNDFNNLFQSLDNFEERIRKLQITIPYFVAGLPGSFYGRLFPSQSVHFFHSSYSLDWISQRLIEEEKFDSFNLPFYSPSAEETKDIIKAQKLFDIVHIQMFESNWDPYDDSDLDSAMDAIQSGQNLATCIRAVHEPIIASHFGAHIIDDLFSRFAINAAMHLAKEKTKFPVLALSLKKKK